MSASEQQPSDDGVLIVGAGLVGSLVADRLARAGIRSTILDAGPLLNPFELSCVVSPARREQAVTRQSIQKQHTAYWRFNPVVFVDDVDNPYVAGADRPFTWIRCRGVGGRSLVWGGVTPRFSPLEFDDPARDGIGPRWPVAYRDLAPYYDDVERTLGVSGSVENIPQLPDGVFLDPMPLTDSEVSFKNVVERRWPDRRVIISRGIAPGGSPETTADSRWPPTTALHVLLPRALASGRVTLRPDSVVARIDVSPESGRATGVSGVERLTHAPFEIRGRAIVLCASPIESVRLLLNSQSTAHPHGIGNSCGLLGKGLLEHAFVSIGGSLGPTARSEPPSPFGGPHSICVPRFRNVGDGSAETLTRGYGLWGGIGRSRVPGQPAGWGLYAMMEVLANDANHVELDHELRDAWGIPAVKIQFEYSDNERRMRDDAMNAMHEMADEASLPIERQSPGVPGAFVHELGGARMGSAPAS